MKCPRGMGKLISRVLQEEAASKFLEDCERIVTQLSTVEPISTPS